LLGTREGAARWLAPTGLFPSSAELAAADRDALVALRESIRAVLRTHTEHTADPEASRALTLALGTGRLTVTLDPLGGARLTGADQDPFARVVAAIAIAIAEAATAGTWSRLKSCPGRLCGWAFYDRSASSGSRWCSMQLCGARAKMRAYRARGLPARHRGGRGSRRLPGTCGSRG
jgi:predicted RNA-binding Zn ribbon-like protein